MLLSQMLSNPTEHIDNIIELEGLLNAQRGDGGLWYLSQNKTDRVDFAVSIQIERKLQNMNLSQYLTTYATSDLTWQLESSVEQLSNSRAYIYQDWVKIKGTLRHSQDNRFVLLLTDIVSITIFRNGYECSLNQDLDSIWHIIGKEKPLGVASAIDQMDGLVNTLVCIEGRLTCNHDCKLSELRKDIGEPPSILVEHGILLPKLKACLSPRSGAFFYTELCQLWGYFHSKKAGETDIKFERIIAARIRRRYCIFSLAI